MDFGIDGNSLVNEMLMNSMKQKDEKLYKFMKVFEKHGIGCIEATAIFLELMPIINEIKEGEKNGNNENQ